MQMKNWLPLVWGPALAIERMPGPLLCRLRPMKAWQVWSWCNLQYASAGSFRPWISPHKCFCPQFHCGLWNLLPDTWTGESPWRKVHFNSVDSFNFRGIYWTCEMSCLCIQSQVHQCIADGSFRRFWGVQSFLSENSNTTALRLHCCY